MAYCWRWQSFCCFPYGVNSHAASSRRKHHWWSVVLNTEFDLVSHWVLMSFILQHGYNIAYFRVILQGSLMHMMRYSKICVLDQQNVFFSFSFTIWFTVIYDLKWSSCLFIKAMNRMWDPVIKGYRKLLFLLLSEDIDNLRVVTDSKSWQTLKPFSLMLQDQTHFNIVVSQPLSSPSWWDIMVFSDLTFWTEM